jgi:hypothetical protein
MPSAKVGLRTGFLLFRDAYSGDRGLTPSNNVRRLQTMFEVLKHCFPASNIVWTEKTMFGTRKQCLKPPNNVFSEKTLFGANLA